MELLITKSELPVFNCLKYTALMEHIDDRHISRETSSQISLARSNSCAMLWCFFIAEVERVISAAGVDDLEGFVA